MNSANYNCLFIQGPSGSGKSTLARRLQQRLGWPHLDRDDFGPRPGCYHHLHQQLREQLPAIVDAPFLYEGPEQFRDWKRGLALNELIVAVLTPTAERRRRRLLRQLPRDQVADWSAVGAEEDLWQPLPGSIHLPGRAPAEILEEIVVWHLGQESRRLRPASPEDRAEVHRLKQQILEQSFVHFLRADELRAEQQQVASAAAIQQLLEDNQVWLAEERSSLVAMAAVSPRLVDQHGQQYRKLFSVYSRSPRAGAALAIAAATRGRQEGLDYLLAWAYRHNRRSQRAMRQLGFYPDGQEHINPQVPRVPVDHWRLDLDWPVKAESPAAGFRLPGPE